MPDKDPERGQWIAHRKANVRRGPKPVDPTTPAGQIRQARDAADVKYKLARLRRVELEISETEGKLIDRETVYRSWAKFCTDARVLLETLPDHLALLVAETDLRDAVRSEAKRIIRDALRSLAGADDSDDVKSDTVVGSEMLDAARAGSAG